MSKNIVAVNDAKVAGRIVYWSLGGEVSAASLQQVWLDANLDAKLLPNEPSEHVALKRAVQNQATKRLLARPVNHGKTWLLVEETPNGSDADYSVRCKSVLGQDGKLNISGDNGFISRIQDDYNKFLNYFDPSDIGNWLVSLAYRCKAVSLRSRGGVYFIPAVNVGYFDEYVNVLRSVAPECNVYQIPALESSEAVEAILAAVQREAAEAVSEIEADISGDASNTVKKNRRKALAELTEKVSFYENLLSANLSSLQEKISSLSFSLAESLLSQENEENQVNV